MTDECSPPATMRDLEWLEKLIRVEIQCARDIVHGEVEALRTEGKIYNQQVDKALSVAEEIATARGIGRMWAVGIAVTLISIAITGAGLFWGHT